MLKFFTRKNKSLPITFNLENNKNKVLSEENKIKKLPPLTDKSKS